MFWNCTKIESNEEYGYIIKDTIMVFKLLN